MRFRPHPNFCVRCTNRGKGCDLDFKDMKPYQFQSAYSYAVTLVVCTEFKQRER